MNCKTVLVANQKGGVGKSAIASHLAFLAAELGMQVLAVDIDAQGNLSRNLLAEGDLEKAPAVALFKGKKPVPLALGADAAAQPKPDKGKRAKGSAGGRIELLAGTRDLKDVDEQPKIGVESLRDGLRHYASGRDLIVLDPPPTLGKRLEAALIAADFVVMPFSPTRESIDGLGELFDTVERVKQESNPNLTVIGLLANLVNPRSAKQAQALVDIESTVGDLLLPDRIVNRTSIADSLANAAPAWRNTHGASQRQAGAELRAACERVLNTVFKK